MHVLLTNICHLLESSFAFVQPPPQTWGVSQHADCSSSRSSAGTAKHNTSLHRPSSKQAASTVSQFDNEAGITYDIPAAQDLKDIRCTIKTATVHDKHCAIWHCHCFRAFDTRYASLVAFCNILPAPSGSSQAVFALVAEWAVPPKIAAQLGSHSDFAGTEERRFPEK